MKIYLSGAMELYTGTNEASKWREEVEKYFNSSNEKVKVINPSKFYTYETKEHTNEFEVFRYDLRLTNNSDIVLVNLKDIRKSVGSIIELYEAYKNNIPVIGFIEDACIDEYKKDDFIKLIHPWIYTICDRIITGKYSIYEACDYINLYYSDLFK